MKDWDYTVICVDSGTIPELTVGKTYEVVGGKLCFGGHTLSNMVNLDVLNLAAAKFFGGRFILAERICDIDE